MIQVGTKLNRHPWDAWLNRKRGEKVKLVKGKDFTCQTYAMTVQIRAAAKKRGRSVSLHVEEHGKDSMIIVTITGRI